MTHFDQELHALQQQIARKSQLETKLTALRARQQELERKVTDLEYQAQKEQTDVDKLEGGGLTAFFYALLGKMDEKLDKEQAEAYAARMRYDAAAQELAAMEADIRRFRDELQTIAAGERRYAELLAKKTAAVKSSGSPDAARVLELETQIAVSKAQQKELSEAITAGKGALRTAQQVLHCLNEANDLATWDLIGGGTLADLAKHSWLDDAQHEVEYLQVQLSRFRTELADVTIHLDLQVRIDGFDLFADYFFDGLLADWNVKGKIEHAIEQATGTHLEIDTVLKKLDGLLSSEQHRQKRLQAELDLLVTEATV